MSAEKNTEPQPAQPTVEQLIAKLVKADEENKANINMMAKAIVELNKKIEAKAAEGNPAGGNPDILSALANLLKPQGGSLEDLAKQAESFNRVADALDRFRHPSRIGLGEALLMRAGVRAIYPRYMTKTEIQRAEKALGVWEVLEEAEGEHPE